MRFETRNALMIGAAILAASYLFDFKNVPIIGALDIAKDRDWETTS